MTKIVIVGGSYAGHLAFLTLYKLRPTLDVIMVSMSTHAYFNVAAPRLLVEPEKFDECVFPIGDFITKHSNGRGKFVHGAATEVDLTAQTVKVDVDGTDVFLSYDFLVLATGTSTQFSGFKVNSSHWNAREAILTTGARVKAANTIAIVGAGPTGVETAGELASCLKSLQVTLYTGRSGPLADFPKLKAGATEKLEKVGVNIVNRKIVKSVLFAAAGDQIVLENGDTKNYDVVLQATRQAPFLGFLPENIKDLQGYVKTTPHLVVEGHSNVLALGDIVSGSPRTYYDLKSRQVAVFTATMKRLLHVDASVEKKYSQGRRSILVPMSADYGEGLLFGFRVPNWMVKLFKSKTFMIEKAGEDFC